MFTLNHKLPVLRCFAVIVLAVLFSAILVERAEAQVVNANDRGWYNAVGTHNPGNNNTFTGQFSGNVYRSYFRFTIPAAVTCVASATLELELENYWGDGTGHTINLSDIAPALVPLLDTTNGSGSGVAIHTDLGSGTSYGSQTGITSASVGSILSFTLPAAALTDIENAAGSDFAVGGMVTTTDPSSLWGLRFSSGNETRVHRLTITTCPLEPDLKATKTVAVYDPDALGLYSIPGSDAIYTINVVNEGTGPVDLDSMVLIDALPAETIFYNDDIDDLGPETNPVAWSETGSGLTFSFATDVAYSNSATAPPDFPSCTYTPSTGYDPNVTFICLNPKGAMANGSPFPEFSVEFRVQIK